MTTTHPRPETTRRSHARRVATAIALSLGGALPLAAQGAIPAFVENRGQTHDDIRFSTNAGLHQTFLTTEGIAVQALQRPHKAMPEERARQALAGTPEEGVNVLIDFVGANPSPEIVMEDLLAGKVNFLLGQDPEHWFVDVPTARAVRYLDLWAGVDLVVAVNSDGVDYRFEAASPAAASQVRLATRGANTVFALDGGELVADTAAGKVLLGRVLCDGAEIRSTEGTVSFDWPTSDEDDALGTKSTLADYFTYVGGSSLDIGHGIDIHVPSSGAAARTFVAGWTASSVIENGVGTPLPPGPFVTTPMYDAFVIKFSGQASYQDPNGGFLWATYLGGDNPDIATDVEVNEDGFVFLCGGTSSTNFPLQNAIDTTPPGTPLTPDAFVACLRPAGNVLEYSTYFGGDGYDLAWAIDAGKDCPSDTCTETSLMACITGETQSTDLLVTAAPGTYGSELNSGQSVPAGTRDAFVSRFDELGALQFSTYLSGEINDGGQLVESGTGDDVGYDVVVNRGFDPDEPSTLEGLLGVTLETHSNPMYVDSDFGSSGPSGGVPTTWFGLLDADDPTDTLPVGAAYFGDTGGGRGIKLFGEYLYLCGWALEGLPTAGGPLADLLQDGPSPICTYSQTGDGYVAGFNWTGSSVEYCTYLGGRNCDIAQDIEVLSPPSCLDPDLGALVFVTGATESPDFPTTPFACDPTYNRGEDAFITLLDFGYDVNFHDEIHLLDSTFIGALRRDVGIDMVFDHDTFRIHVVGHTESSTNFPISPLPFDDTYNGQVDAYFLKLLMEPFKTDCD